MQIFGESSQYTEGTKIVDSTLNLTLEDEKVTYATVHDFY